MLETEVMPGWTSPGQAYLMWPRGSEFPDHGLNVPFNHQNEWALGVLRTQSDGDASQQADAVLSLFYDQVLAPNGGRFPDDGVWPYWWGVAWDGWTAEDLTSVNHPASEGELVAAWISFKTIDATAMIEWSKSQPDQAGAPLRASASELVEAGSLLPQLAAALVEMGQPPQFLDEHVLGVFGRATTPSELPDAVWANVLQGV